MRGRGSGATALGNAATVPKAFVCGMLEDSGRTLFLVERGADGTERLALPGRAIGPGENEVAAVKDCFARQAGLDVQVHEVGVQGKYNAGSRRRKVWVPALGFRVTAKNCAARARPPFTGIKWLALRDVRKGMLARTAEWISTK